MFAMRQLISLQRFIALVPVGVNMRPELLAGLVLKDALFAHAVQRN